MRTIRRTLDDATPRAFCVSIDVERDYRKDGVLSFRGIDEGLPLFVDELRSRQIPFDLMVSGEIAENVPKEMFVLDANTIALGCHGQTHSPGYLNRMDPPLQEEELHCATRAITRRFGQAPRVFRAPNFSANGDTIRILAELGYRVDSSVLPGRWVKKWRIKTLVDHRGIPSDPFFSDPIHYPKEGGTAILEVPVTSDPTASGSPLGLGLLNFAGPAKFAEALGRSEGKYVVFLAHTWEMVHWNEGTAVAAWVRSASRPPSKYLDALLSSLEGWRFMNLEQIAQREQKRRENLPHSAT